jgi:hypothetical protein
MLTPAPAPAPAAPTLAGLRVARSLARAFGHGWATDTDGPTDTEIFDLGIDAAVEAWEARLAKADAVDDGERQKWRGLGPALSHRSGSGTVEWRIAPDGAVDLRVAVSARYPIPPDAGRVLWTLHVSADGSAVTGGLVPGAAWPVERWPGAGHERACAACACAALGVRAAWLTPLPSIPAPPLVTKEPLRRF